MITINGIGSFNLSGSNLYPISGTGTLTPTTTLINNPLSGGGGVTTAPTNSPTATVPTAASVPAQIAADLENYPVQAYSVEVQAVEYNNTLNPELKKKLLDGLEAYPNFTAYDVRIMHTTISIWLMTGRFTVQDCKEFLAVCLGYKNAFAARAQIVYRKQGGTDPKFDPQNPANVPTTPGTTPGTTTPGTTPENAQSKTVFYIVAAAVVVILIYLNR